MTSPGAYKTELTVTLHIKAKLDSSQDWTSTTSALKKSLNQSTAVVSYLMNLDALVGSLVGDGKLEDDLLVVVGFDDLGQLVGEVDVVHLRGGGLKLNCHVNSLKGTN